ncbi:MAG TPA: UDP-N-acetylglucosamine--N-acetylmuramyl-(pentapeptide) pyrophosphoryl-undecaprenol N-acetylglucosamine transferase [Verrucomicrobiae bacterium]|nr:UDP-N-acetylglucosamine--N-acetylmuramyl-(pentapeptide) pyrophosphoryl-undecaprenol N-acetylglucosamine transferase [Verrucomicrobiae bacterium]
MMPPTGEQLNVAIACGGTGGHLFPGLAVADQLARQGAAITLMVSNKEIDQVASKSATGIRLVTLPAVGLTRGQIFSFLNGFVGSYRIAAAAFAQHPPQAVLAMGGFTSAPPILAARRLGAATFLHESNSIPGRANRWLSWVVERAFVGFAGAAERLHNRHVSVTGTPVRDQFKSLDQRACRTALNLDGARPVALVMGGSQGAHGINELILKSLELIARRVPDWQWLHLAGAADVAVLEQAYQRAGLTARVYPFLADMDLALGAATAAVSRAGASSLAELAAVRLPSVLVPFPAATDNHQFHNARAFVETGAARLLEQRSARPQEFVELLVELMCNQESRRALQQALATWHKPQAAEQIAQAILERIRSGSRSKTLSLARGKTAADKRTGTDQARLSQAKDSTGSSARMQTAVL